MKISASDPDIETLVARIRRKELNLRPDFQRGEVWSETKRQKLIDTILRGWQVPPIHVISVIGTSELEVLDGQQRLAAVRDFASGDLYIDGNTKPLHPAIQALDRLRFSHLPAQWQRRFNQYAIRVFTITEYEPDEPYELFYRLNHPTTLTSAEQRNAFFGPAREQVKRLVEWAQVRGFTSETIGFSNGRMAYDDVLARTCMFSEAKTFHARVTAAALADRYRANDPFPEDVTDSVERAISVFADARALYGRSIRLNKATLLTWLLFTASSQALGPDPIRLAELIEYFERNRNVRGASSLGEEAVTRQWISLFEDRASSRVNDTLSIASRDFVVWLLFAGARLQPACRSSKFVRAEECLRMLRASLSQGEYLEPAEYVQTLLLKRRWDLCDEGC